MAAGGGALEWCTRVGWGQVEAAPTYPRSTDPRRLLGAQAHHLAARRLRSSLRSLCCAHSGARRSRGHGADDAHGRKHAAPVGSAQRNVGLRRQLLRRPDPQGQGLHARFEKDGVDNAGAMVELVVQVDRGADEGQVAEGLGEVAELLAGISALQAMDRELVSDSLVYRRALDPTENRDAGRRGRSERSRSTLWGTRLSARSRRTGDIAPGH
jgi:hypothetical protein